LCLAFHSGLALRLCLVCRLTAWLVRLRTIPASLLRLGPVSVGLSLLSFRSLLLGMRLRVLLTCRTLLRHYIGRPPIVLPFYRPIVQTSVVLLNGLTPRLISWRRLGIGLALRSCHVAMALTPWMPLVLASIVLPTLTSTPSIFTRSISTHPVRVWLAPASPGMMTAPPIVPVALVMLFLLAVPMMAIMGMVMRLIAIGHIV
jgi:hypothetical protein